MPWHLTAQAGADAVPGFIAGAGGVTAAALLAWLLYWFMTRHLPSKDAQIERLIERKDEQDQRKSALFEAALEKVVLHCADESRASREQFERWHAEQMEALGKIHESAREGVHATRNMHASVANRLRLADMVQSAEVPIWTKSLDGTVLSWNAAAERLLHWRQGEMVGASVYGRVIPADRRAEEEEVLRRISRGETIPEYETVRLARDERRVPLAVTTSPVRDQAGRVVAASTIARPLDPQ